MAIHKLNNNSLSNLTEFSGTAAIGDMKLISSSDIASGTSSVEFTLGDKKEYKFFFVNIHPATNDVNFRFQSSIDSGSNYNVTMTTTRFKAGHTEADNYTVLGYEGGSDQAQGTGFQTLTQNVGNENDESLSGMLHIFNPSSTTFVKHFTARFNTYQHGNASYDDFTAGYFNDTNDLTNIKFQMSSGNIDDGKILMFGLD